MPVNSSLNADALSGIEEEADMYEGFAPNVDPTNIASLTDTPSGKSFMTNLKKLLIIFLCQLIFSKYHVIVYI
jgi:hypothetical protein